MAKKQPEIWKVWVGLDSTPGYEWVNEPPLPMVPGPFHHLGNRNGQESWGSGFPTDMDPPLIALDRRLGRPLTDAENIGGYQWLLSERAKQVLEQLDGEAFTFVAAQSVFRDRAGERPGPTLWLADVIRFLDAYVPNSDAVMTTRYPGGHISQEPIRLGEAPFQRDVVGDHKFFRTIYDSTIYAPTAVKKVIKHYGLTGFMFRPGGYLNV